MLDEALQRRLDLGNGPTAANLVPQSARGRADNFLEQHATIHELRHGFAEGMAGHAGAEPDADNRGTRVDTFDYRAGIRPGEDETTVDPDDVGAAVRNDA